MSEPLTLTIDGTEVTASMDQWKEAYQQYIRRRMTEVKAEDALRADLDDGEESIIYEEPGHNIIVKRPFNPALDRIAAFQTYVAFRIDAGGLTAIDKLAKANGVDRSEMIRLMLAHGLAHPDRKWKQPPPEKETL